MPPLSPCSPRLLLLTLGLVLGLAGAASAVERDVQIVEVDFVAQTIELFNFGSGTEDLDGWRFCSHSETMVLRYSSSTGLNGVSIPPMSSLTIHLLSDSGGASGTIDRPAGNFATPFDETAHGLQIYFDPVSFGNGNTIADHVQWSIGGVDDLSADERSDEAETGGVWTDQSTWVATASDSTSIMLLPASNGLVLHGPSDYTAVPEPGMLALLAAGVVGLVSRSRTSGRSGVHSVR